MKERENLAQRIAPREGSHVNVHVQAVLVRVRVRFPDLTRALGVGLEPGGWFEQQYSDHRLYRAEWCDWQGNDTGGIVMR